MSPLIRRDMSNDEAAEALAGENDEARGTFYAILDGLNTRDAKREVLELCAKHGLVGETATRFYESICGENPYTFRLILTLEETGARKYNLAKNVRSGSGRNRLRDTIRKDPFMNMAHRIVLPN